MKPTLKNAYKCEMVEAKCPAPEVPNRKFTHTVECAFSAADAMQRALEEKPGCIILRAWRGLLGVDTGRDGYAGWTEYEVPKHGPYTKPTKTTPAATPDFPFDFDSMKKPQKEENQHL